MVNQKTGSRGFNRSQVPATTEGSMPHVMHGGQNAAGNNIGIIQNFNSYHIELKNMGGSAAGQQQSNLQNNQLSPEDIKSLDRLVRQQ